MPQDVEFTNKEFEALILSMLKNSMENAVFLNKAVVNHSCEMNVMLKEANRICSILELRSKISKWMGLTSYYGLHKNVTVIQNSLILL